MGEETTKIWKPNSVQEEFLSLPDTIFEALYGGAAFGGKSEVLMMLPIVREFYKRPRFKGLILRRTYPELEREIIRRSFDFYPQTGATYNVQTRSWRWPWGAYLDFGHSEFEDDIRKFDTAEYNYIAFDELTSFLEFQYVYLAASRCRSSDISLPAIVRSGTNPGNVGHSWVRKRFVEPCREGRKVLKDNVTGQKRVFIPAKATDNLVGMKADPDYVKRLELLPPAEKAAKLYGDFWTFEGQVFDEFREKKFPNEPSNALHVIPSFTIPSWWPRIIAIDWGFSAMTYVLRGAVSPDGRCYIDREYGEKKKKISEWVPEIKERLLRDENVRDIVIDPSARQSRGEEKTIFQQVYEELGENLRVADNDRIGGKLLIQEFLRWRPRPIVQQTEDYNQEVAIKILKDRGTDAYHEYLASFGPQEPENNIPRLQIFQGSCPLLVKAIQSCVYDEKQKEDVSQFDGDDPYDCLRYLLKAVHHYTSGASREFQRLHKADEIVKHLEETGNQTEYYRQMKVLESKKEHPVSVKIRRGRVGRLLRAS